MNNLDANFNSDVKKYKVEKKENKYSVFDALKEVFWPGASSQNWGFNGWLSNESFFNKLKCFFFAKPWVWLLYVTIASVFLLLVVSIVAQSNGMDAGTFKLLVLIGTIVVSCFSALYAGAALFLWSRKFKYPKQDFLNKANDMTSSNGKQPFTSGDVVNIETSISSKD